ncbi:MAG: DUF4097 family beta strand repeat-containing protein [Acidobacteriota bacterium]|nr:DUF4097 family beta strand repeat-containing protein [Acidobacteriota bacterium]
MGSYPPPPPPPPFGGDWKYQRRLLKDQAKAQRDIARAQRDAYRYQIRGMRRSSILGPLILITLGLVFLLVQTGRLHAHRLWEWYARFWPLLLIGAGIVMLLEWVFDHYMQSDPDRPRYRRRVGGGVFTLLVLLAFTGLVFSGMRDGDTSRILNGLNLNQDNMDEFMGDKHESDQTLTQSFPAKGGFSVDNPRGDITISGTSDDNQIHISIHKEVFTRSDSDADSKAQQLSPILTTRGTDLHLAVPSEHGARADLTITLPPNAPLMVDANHGDVRISGIKAPLQVTANHGDIELSAITGPVQTRINNGESSLSAHSISGPLDVEGKARDTTLTDLSGPVTMRGDYFGTTHFERIRGPIKFHTSRTDLQLVRLDGEIEISNNADLTASDVVGPLILTTGNRNITLDRIGGDVSVTNRNGSVDLTNAPPLSNVTIENRNGSVTVTVPERSTFAYQLEATNGSLQSDFSEIKTSGEDDAHKKSINGTVGNGTVGNSTGAPPMIRISTSQGDVSLKKASITALPPLPPLPPAPPKITVLPPDARQSIEDARQSVREAQQEVRQATQEAKQQAREAAIEARQQTKEAQHEAKEAQAEALRTQKEAQQNNNDSKQ